ncbi:uncharacterized protein LOC114318894 isoform X4 [Camellia sinensis]|uniref:uncharacterized protein LOC114318894 isoform X4 n=1 Tax=Camellia sinensis TaxID=4442 RepID=UPI0010365285|nr:uncharacterized protein LOC114318894 isoform X4 [Camellia sinensis]
MAHDDDLKSTGDGLKWIIDGFLFFGPFSPHVLLFKTRSKEMFREVQSQFCSSSVEAFLYLQTSSSTTVLHVSPPRKTTSSKETTLMDVILIDKQCKFGIKLTNTTGTIVAKIFGVQAKNLFSITTKD